MGSGKHAGLEEWKEQLKIFIWTEHTIRGGIAAFIQAAGKIQERTGKNHGFFLQLCQIKSMRPWQKNFVKVLTGAALVWYI